MSTNAPNAAAATAAIATVAAPAPAPAPAAPNPRVGGGTDSDSWWTGGSNVPALQKNKPRSNLARRPTDLRNSGRIEEACKKGLPEERRLKLPGEPSQTITLSYWLREIKKKLEDCGMDTVFRMYDPSRVPEEKYLISSFGSTTKSDFNSWINALTTTGVKTTTTTANSPVCQFDLENLDWSADMLKDSVSFKLWQDIVPLLSGETGPEVFMAIVTRVQYTSASTTRSFLNDLEALQLPKEPGMNVANFSTKVLEQILKLEQCDASTLPPDLSLVTAKCFLHTGVTMFDVEAIRIFNLCDKNLQAMTPRQIIEELKTKYISLEDLGEWPHKTQKEKHDEISALHAQLNALQQKFDNSKINSSGVGQRDLSNISCHGCGQKGHYKNHCPNVITAGVTSEPPTNATQPPAWMFKGPNSGESEVKLIEGIEYKWCSKCKLGKDQKPMWRQGNKRHVTSECRSKPRPAAAAGSLNTLAVNTEAKPAPETLNTSTNLEDSETFDGPLLFRPVFL